MPIIPRLLAAGIAELEDQTRGFRPARNGRPAGLRLTELGRAESAGRHAVRKRRNSAKAVEEHRLEIRPLSDVSGQPLRASLHRPSISGHSADALWSFAFQASYPNCPLDFQILGHGTAFGRPT